MQELQLLNEKLDLLLKKYSGVQTENLRLQQVVARQLQLIEQLNLQLGELEERVEALQTGQVITGPDERAAVRQQLDTVIGAIDKILTTLND
ncbi:hypothetical protein ACTHGU_07605 [Chitinophagaceae bacterium MMS25-I14]